jgi:hypothetical protein
LGEVEGGPAFLNTLVYEVSILKTDGFLDFEGERTKGNDKESHTQVPRHSHSSLAPQMREVQPHRDPSGWQHYGVGHEDVEVCREIDRLDA